MRLLLSLLIIFAGIISFGFWINHQLKTSTDDLLLCIEQIEQEIQNNQWEKASTQTLKLAEMLDKKLKWWPTVLDHQEIDNIEFSLAKTGEYIAEENIVLSRGQLSELKMMIEHIPEKEAINLKNIF